MPICRFQLIWCCYYGFAILFSWNDIVHWWGQTIKFNCAEPLAHTITKLHHHDNFTDSNLKRCRWQGVTHVSIFLSLQVMLAPLACLEAVVIIFLFLLYFNTWAPESFFNLKEKEKSNFCVFFVISRLYFRLLLCFHLFTLMSFSYTSLDKYLQA